ncbi:hypothetical protein XENOCAPTIV_000394, partial [Xenoophorus captivus]
KAFHLKLCALQAYRLHLCVAELLAATLVDSGVFSTASCVSGHSWAMLKSSNTIQDRVRDIWEEEFHICLNSAGDWSIEALVQELKSVDTPARSGSIPLRQVLLYSSVHLTRSLLSWLLNDDGQLITELWQAVAWLRDAGHFSISAVFCRLLFPEGIPAEAENSTESLYLIWFERSLQKVLLMKLSVCHSGDVSVFSRKHSKTLQQSKAEAEASSLQAFVCYHRLYECWWRDSAVQTGTGSCREDKLNDEALTAGTLELEERVYPTSGTSKELDFEPSVLLSEPHAAFQATQKSVREIQERLSAMVLQHSQVQVGQLDSGNKQDGSLAQTTSLDQQEATEVEQWSGLFLFLHNI